MSKPWAISLDRLKKLGTFAMFFSPDILAFWANTTYLLHPFVRFVRHLYRALVRRNSFPAAVSALGDVSWIINSGVCFAAISPIYIFVQNLIKE